jgi:predicted ester cyclase
MKSFVLGILLFIPFISNSQTLDNKKVIESLFLEGWNDKNFEVFKEQVNDTITFHFNNQHFKTSFMDLKYLVNMWHNAFQNFSFEISHIIAEGDLVAANLRFSGKHVNEFMGVKPKNNEISVSEMMFFRFEEGKLVEAWEVYDERGMLNQMKVEK